MPVLRMGHSVRGIPQRARRVANRLAVTRVPSGKPYERKPRLYGKALGSISLERPPRTPEILDTIEFCWRCVGKPNHVTYHRFFRNRIFQPMASPASSRRQVISNDLRPPCCARKLHPLCPPAVTPSLTVCWRQRGASFSTPTRQRDAKHSRLWGMRGRERSKTLGSGPDKKSQVTLDLPQPRAAPRPFRFPPAGPLPARCGPGGGSGPHGRPSPARGLLTKRTDHAEAGIPEYRIVDPRFATVTTPLTGDEYAEPGVFACSDRAASLLLAREARTA